MRKAKPKPVYLGDGVDMRMLGNEIKLQCNRDGIKHYVFLGPNELHALILQAAKSDRGLLLLINAALKEALTGRSE